MTATAEIDEILDLISQEGLIDRAKLTPETRLDELGMSSLEMINILFALESKYDITIEADDVKQVVVLADLVGLVNARVQSAGGTAS